MQFDSVNGRKYWRNGGTNPEAFDLQTTQLISFTGAAIGAATYCCYYKGDIGEFIVFTRALNKTERQSVEEYLSQKWGVPIS